MLNIMINSKADEVIEESLKHFVPSIKLGWKHQWKVAISILVFFINYITNVIKNFKRGGTNINSPKSH